MRRDLDIERHNASVAELWEGYHAREPARVPCAVNVSTRYTIFNREVNPRGYTFEDYFGDPDLMFDHQLRHQWWVRHNVIADAPVGPAEQYAVNVDLQNSYEAIWFGCPLEFWEDQCPDTRPLLTDDGKWVFQDAGLPALFPETGWFAKAWDTYERFKERAAHEEFRGGKIIVGAVPGLGTDGPFTAACSLRGGVELMLDMRVDTDYYMALMEYIVTATIERIRAYRERLGHPVETEAWGFADDSVQMLSLQDYETYVLPFHRRLVEAFGPKGPNSIHLCGDVERLLPTIQRELNAQSFDTGFPVDHGRLRRALGPDAEIRGGPHVATVHGATPGQVRAAVREVLESGIKEGGRFILHEGNNLPPGTPLENLDAMHEACLEYGVH